MSDKASLSDIEFARQVGRFRRPAVAISAAVGYDSGDDSRRAHPLRTASPARVGAAGRRFSREFRGRGPLFRRRGACRPRFRRKFRSAVGRGLAPPPGAEKRRRGHRKPAQPARGRGDASGRDRPRQTRARARAGGTGLFRLPDAGWPRRSFAPRAPRRGGRRPAGAARPTNGGGARRRARACGCARQGRPQSSRPKPRRR